MITLFPWRNEWHRYYYINLLYCCAIPYFTDYIKCCGISFREDGTEDDLIFDGERSNDVNIDETDKKNDILVEIEGEHYEEVDGFRNVWWHQADLINLILYHGTLLQNGGLVLC